jgi:uncharacterized membrane protein YgcG
MRLFTGPQLALLRAPSLVARVCMTFYLDEGTYRFNDDVINTSDGTNTYVGANPLANSLEIRSGRDLAAEPITLILDGNKMTQAGVDDPARVLSDILTYLHQQRRVDIHLGLSYPESTLMEMMISMAAMKINHVRLTDERIEPFSPNSAVAAKLHIVMDSLAARYSRAPYRTRSHNDQLEIDPSDMFFSFVGDAINIERTLYWGKKAQTGGAYSGGYTSGSGSGGGSYTGGAPNGIFDPSIGREYM